MYQGIKSNKA
jgi:dynein heavy chain